jgi:tungstate transport system permease protein
MQVIWDGLREGLGLLLGGDRELYEVAGRSLLVSSLATLLGLAVGGPLGAFLGLRSFPGRNLLLALVNTGMALPPVVVGLAVFLLLARDGPLGALGLLFTPWAMVLAQGVLTTPLVAGLTAVALQSLHPRLRWQLLALGASRWQYLWLLLREARATFLAALMLAFGVAVHEVGASLMVGGNIRGETRVLTTSIVLYTARGEFERAIALALVLLALMYALMLALTALQQRRAGQ